MAGMVAQVVLDVEERTVIVHTMKPSIGLCSALLVFVCGGTGYCGTVLQFSLAKGCTQLQTGNTNFNISVVPWFIEARVEFTNYSTLRVTATGPRSALLVPFVESSVIAGTSLYEGSDQSIGSAYMLNHSYPDADYTFSFGSGTQKTNVVVHLSSASLPPVPRVANLADLQSIDPASPLTVIWDPIVGASDLDQIELRIDNGSKVVFATGTVLGMDGALGATATSITVPAGTFLAGRDYVGHLTYYKVTARYTDDIPGFAAACQRTDFPIITQGTSIPTIISAVPALDSTNVPMNTPIVFRFDRPMRTNGYDISMTGSGFGDCAWIDSTTFMVTPSGYWGTGLSSLYLNSGGLAFCDTNSVFVFPQTLVTRFSVGSKLLAAKPSSPRVTFAATPGTESVRITIDGEAYRRYQLQASTNLLDWQAIDSTFTGTTNCILTDSVGLNGSRFYRVMVTPQ